MRTIVILMALFVATPAFAQAVNVVVQNTSQDTIESINVYPAGADVSVGTYTTPIAPGQAGRIELSLQQCQAIDVLVKIKDNPTTFKPTMDLCLDPLLTVGE